MSLAWRVSFTATALKQLKKMDRRDAETIARFLADRIAGPEDARRLGHALTGNLEGSWRYRVGDYRVLCRLRDSELLVVVVAIGHRREIYR